MMTKYVRKNDYEAIQLDGEWIILDADNYTVTKLNETGGFCWSLFTEAQSIETLMHAVRDRYKQVDETIEQDLEAFLSDLYQCGLIENAS
ncbi:PqqD family protein [Paenibacillus sp. H1-7]|uniref:PqqD family protein n=1 Tax=Paenibacillus sp. H1-7 TaxID=2282849 RepID=UPI001EF96953|nr:PqqD family protein [Paenibacillus sp. H1-7]ULL16613.1 PqqD family protein [Paenibacillus sp. H1-7]